MAFRVAPNVDATFTADKLQPYFTGAATLTGALLVGFGVVSATTGELRFLRFPTFLALAAGTALAVIGLIPTLATWCYRFLVALTVACWLYGLIAMLLTIRAHFAGQRAQALRERVEQLGGRD